MIWALQNDHQNRSFVIDKDLLGDKMIRNSHKNGQTLACHFHFETLFIKVLRLDFFLLLTSVTTSSDAFAPPIKSEL